MFWWARFIFFAAVSVFFLHFGIGEMIQAYQVNNPVEFLGRFFSSSFIILISGTLLAAFLWRMWDRIRSSPEHQEQEPGLK